MRRLLFAAGASQIAGPTPDAPPDRRIFCARRRPRPRLLL